MLEYAHLHVHTDASVVDGLGKVSRLVEAAASIGFPALAMTDHGNLSNAIAFTNSCKYHGIKPIMGCEFYVEHERERFHLTALAHGNRGFNTLVQLNNEGHEGPDPKFPTIPLSRLLELNDGLILLTGCPSSPFQRLPEDEALDLGRRFKREYGSRLFAEAMIIDDGQHVRRAEVLSRELGIPPVFTNDVHFPYPKDATSHRYLTQMKAGFEYDSTHLFLATPTDLLERVALHAPAWLDFMNEGIENAYRLARKLRPVKFDSTPKLPHIDDAYDQLFTETMAGLATLGLSELEEYVERVTDELSVIRDMNYPSYFLILKDIIDYARSIGVWVGPGRGSGAGSLVLYCLGITNVDPIEFGLSFDRFLNRKRAEMPDVDVDIESERRGEVLEYASKRWGGFPIAVYSRYSHKSLVHDIAKSFRIPRDVEEAMAIEGDDNGPVFKQQVVKHPEMGELYHALLGQIRHLGKHAGGLVIVPEDTTVPMVRIAQGETAAAWTEGDTRELTKAGLVKFDLLGLTSGSILARLMRVTGEVPPFPKDDDPVFEIFRSGDLDGIFQFSGSDGIIRMTVNVAPRQFEDLVAINALYRPGALNAGTANHYHEWRDNPRLIHPAIDDILEPTFGIIVYQEQFMQIYARLTGGDMADADMARKVITKARPDQVEWQERFADLQLNFFDGCTEHGLSDADAKKIWGEIVTHTRYSFNRAHSVSYAMIAWSMAWFKYHYPLQFYASLMSVDMDYTTRLFKLAADGVELRPPHVNHAGRDFKVVDGAIQMPLSVIKWLGESGVSAVLAERPFKSAKDFMARVPKKAVRAQARRGLYEMGSFDGMPDASPKTLQFSPLVYESEGERQREHMGIELPTVELVDMINGARELGLASGVVGEVQVRESRFGAYNVYRLMPDGAFWSRDFDLEVGQRVALKVKSSSGKILKVYDLEELNV